VTNETLAAPAASLPPSAPARALAERRRHTRRRLAVVGLILAAVVGFLLYKVLTSAVVYFKTAQEAVASRATLGNQTFDIEGVVVCGSVHATGAAVDDFVIASGPARVTVQNAAVPPQLFEAGVPVVLVGHFVAGSNTFASEQILIKHSNSYAAANPGRLKTPSALQCFSGQT
jgi:cytochrome c-type biogenesis protein CcmE